MGYDYDRDVVRVDRLSRALEKTAREFAWVEFGRDVQVQRPVSGPGFTLEIGGGGRCVVVALTYVEPMAAAAIRPDADDVR